MFTRAIARTPGKSITAGLSKANLGLPDYKLALIQHTDYVNALRACRLDVKVLPPDEDYPDSTFVEDTAILTSRCAIITNPGAPSRKGEILKMKEIISNFYSNIEEIIPPGTLEAGDVMMAGDHYYIGISERTNTDGADQLINILQKYGMTGSKIFLKNMLHLKTGVSYLENNNLVVFGELKDSSEFDTFNKIIIPDDEAYAANCIWLNGNVLVPSGYPKTSKRILEAGYAVEELHMSEFQKIDGGLSCLSLRF